MPLRSAGLSNTSLITATGTCAGRTLADRFADVANVEDWRGCNGDNSDTSTINSAFAAINASGGHLMFPGHATYDLEDLLTPLTGSDIWIEGNQATLRVPDTVTLFPEIGTFFRLGTVADRADNIIVRGFRLNLAKTLVDDNVFAVRLDNATGCEVSQIRFTGLAGLIKYGSDLPQFATRCTIRDWFGTANQGLNSDANILLRNGAAGEFSRIFATGVRVPGGSTNGAIIKISPEANPLAGIDTFHFNHCGLAFFDTTDPSFGKPFGVLIERTLTDVTNLWFSNCAIDHTGSIGFYFDGGSGSNTLFTRTLQVRGCRFATDEGIGVKIDNSAGGTLRGCKFDGNIVVVSTNSAAFHLLAPGIDVDVIVSGNSFLEGNTSVTKDNAVLLNASGWTVVANKISSVTPVQRFDNAFAIQDSGTGLGTDYCTLGPNTVSAGIGYVTEPGAYTTPNSPNRHIDKRNPPPCRLLSNFSTTSTALVDITGMSIALKPSKVYRVSGDIVWTSSDLTQGAGFAFAGPTADFVVTRFIAPVDQNSAGILTPTNRRMFNASAAILSVDTVGGDMYHTAQGLIKTTAAASPVLTLRAMSEAGATIIVKAGSYFKVEEI